MIKEDIMTRSLKVAQEIINFSSSLKEVESNAEYWNRDIYLQELLGEDGYVSFHPTVTFEVASTFSDKTSNKIKEFYHTYCNTLGAESSIALFRYRILTRLVENINNECVFDNKVPDAVSSFIDEYSDHRYPEEVRKYARNLKSPKLSKLLVKLFGETDDIVKWYTCKCPQKMTKGILNDWKVTLSILPHHIAGMSYYGSFNHGGKRWLEGWKGTSCMDTLRNGDGSIIYCLIPSLKDETMAVAYLSHVTDDDIWNPVYQARVLLRVCYVNGKPILLACRPYFVSNEATHILIDGLKNRFGNVHFVDDIREFNYKSSEPDIWLPFDYKLSDDITLCLESVKCDECGGTGIIEDFYECEACGGEGIKGTTYYHIYIDDEDFISVDRDVIRFQLPEAYLKHVGLLEKDREKDCEKVTA